MGGKKRGIEAMEIRVRRRQWGEERELKGKEREGRGKLSLNLRPSLRQLLPH